MSIKARKTFLFVGILISVISACLGLETQHSNHLGWALLFAGALFCASGVITLGLLFLHDPSQKQARDRSLWLPIFSVLALSLVTPLEYLYLTPSLARNDLIQDIGLILFAGGLSLYLLMLNSPVSRVIRKVTTSLKVKGDRPLLIRWICHPGFASLVLLALGLCIGYSSLIGILMVFFLLLPGLVLWMKAEDRKLQRKAL